MKTVPSFRSFCLCLFSASGGRRGRTSGGDSASFVRVLFQERPCSMKSVARGGPSHGFHGLFPGEREPARQSRLWTSGCVEWRCAPRRAAGAAGEQRAERQRESLRERRKWKTNLKKTEKSLSFFLECCIASRCITPERTQRRPSIALAPTALAPAVRAAAA